MPRLAVSAAVFYASFVGINLSRGRSFDRALLNALIIEATFIVAVSVFLGAILLIAVKAAPRRQPPRE